MSFRNLMTSSSVPTQSGFFSVPHTFQRAAGPLGRTPSSSGPIWFLAIARGSILASWQFDLHDFVVDLVKDPPQSANLLRHGLVVLPRRLLGLRHQFRDVQRRRVRIEAVPVMTERLFEDLEVFVLPDQPHPCPAGVNQPRKSSVNPPWLVSENVMRNSSPLPVLITMYLLCAWNVVLPRV